MPSKKKNVKKLSCALEKIQLCDPIKPDASKTDVAPTSEAKNIPVQNPVAEKPENEVVNMKLVFNEVISPESENKWPKYKNRIPPIFLHKPAEFDQHAKKLIYAGVKFFQPHKGHQHTRINCEALDDYKTMTNYFQRLGLPYHTFGLPSKRKVKFVIRGVPENTDLAKLKNAFKSADVPVVRIHKMHRKRDVPGKPILLLVVVPCEDKGKEILKLEKIDGSAVKIEKPILKPKQCHRCQMWGHSQRYCQGNLHCVKCGGDHLTKKCLKNKETEQPKCINCGKPHTANYKLCSFCPDSVEYLLTVATKKIIKIPIVKPCIVTMDNYSQLYRNVKINKEQ